MDLSIEELERRIDELRAGIKQAMQAGDRALVRELKADLKTTHAAWDAAVSRIAPRPATSPVSPASSGRGAGRPSPDGAAGLASAVGGTLDGTGAVHSLVPLREQVHHALTLLTVPAAPRLIVAVHGAFFGASVASARLTSLRRDEEKSFRSAPYARPYYLCPALTADRLAPARALLSISTWSLADRMVGPLSPRVHFLTAAIKVAEAVARLTQPARPEARRLLLRFAANIPGGTDGGGTPASVIAAATDELVIHQEADRATREEAARRAKRLNDVQRLFGVRLAAVPNRQEAG